MLEHRDKDSIQLEAYWLNVLDSFIGDLYLEAVHMGSLQNFIDLKKQSGNKHRTINIALQVVRRILNLAASEWLDENGVTWLAHAPKVKALVEYDSRKPYSLTWDEQDRLFGALPIHLRRMSLFGVNTGCRNKVICNLRWEWERAVPEIPDCRIFIEPFQFVKNRRDRLIVLNDVARAVVEEVRGLDNTHVFAYKGKPIRRMLNSAWKRAREKADLPMVRVHDLKHTFGSRLRAAGVSFEDRQDLLGHASNRITTHYSAADLGQLIAAANKVCHRMQEQTFTVLQLSTNTTPANLPQAVEQI